MADIIKANGKTVLGIKPENGTDYSLKELREYIGAEMVQMICIGSSELMWIDENGKYTCPEKKNQLATMLLQMNNGILGDYIAGDVFICKKDEVK